MNIFPMMTLFLISTVNGIYNPHSRIRLFEISYILKTSWYDLIKNEVVMYGSNSMFTLEQVMEMAVKEDKSIEPGLPKPSDYVSSFGYQNAFATRAMKMLSLMAHYGIRILVMDEIKGSSDQQVFDLVKNGFEAITYYSDHHISYRYWDEDYNGEFEAKTSTEHLCDLLKEIANRVKGCSLKTDPDNHLEVFGTLVKMDKQNVYILDVFQFTNQTKNDMIEHLEKIVETAQEEYRFNDDLTKEPGYESTYINLKPV